MQQCGLILLKFHPFYHEGSYFILENLSASCSIVQFTYTQIYIAEIHAITGAHNFNYLVKITCQKFDKCKHMFVVSNNMTKLPIICVVCFVCNFNCGFERIAHVEMIIWRLRPRSVGGCLPDITMSAKCGSLFLHCSLTAGFLNIKSACDCLWCKFITQISLCWAFFCVWGS